MNAYITYECCQHNLMCSPCSILPNFLNIMRPDLQSADQREWWRVLCQLQETLRDTADFLVKVKKVK